MKDQTKLPPSRRRVTDEVSTLYFRGMPRTLCNHFRSSCLRRNTTMKAVLLDFMKQFVKDEKTGNLGKKKGQK